MAGPMGANPTERARQATSSSRKLKPSTKAKTTERGADVGAGVRSTPSTRPASYRTNVVPTLLAMNASGIAWAICWVANQPVQWPGTT